MLLSFFFCFFFNSKQTSCAPQKYDMTYEKVSLKKSTIFATKNLIFTSFAFYLSYFYTEPEFYK